MSFRFNPTEQLLIGRYLLKWTILASVVGVLGGSASALFLVTLDLATETRIAHSYLIYFLPLGGLLVGLLYHYFGRGVEGGNNLLLDQIHEPSSGVPAKLAPLILVTTVLTHLVGGSAGREGTAVQMGGSLASWFARLIRLDAVHGRILLMAGVSAGFGAVFGTPIAGLVFGLEFLAVGRLRYDALIPCLVASLVGDWTCIAWGVTHTPYAVASVTLGPALVGKVVLASFAFAMASIAFAELTVAIHAAFARVIRWPVLRPVVGGMILLGLFWLVETDIYLGLGIPLIVDSFTLDEVPRWAFLWKILFTALTLGCGFKGGEVTPLFCIGATLGCTLAALLGMPADLAAALGFVAVFAGASNTPLACTIMGIELFGSEHAVCLAIACCSAYLWSGHRGIYLAQRIDTPKGDHPGVPADATLAQMRQTKLNGTPIDTRQG